jgi:rhodanese-related sulfurtransferase
MKKLVLCVFFSLCISFSGISVAEITPTPIPITADEAFDAVQNQTDPITGEDTSVVLIDVRSRAEFFWVGAACKVDEIVKHNGHSIIPDNGKATLSKNGRFLRFRLNGKKRRIQVDRLKELMLSPIAINVPYKLWDEETGTLDLNPSFTEDVNAIGLDYDVAIFFCRSGGRSQDCIGSFDTDLFDAIYEIDQPDEKSGRGGFEGTSYSNVYNGYRGFPGRFTRVQEHPSVSWKDAGLPIKTSLNPLDQ